MADKLVPSLLLGMECSLHHTAIIIDFAFERQTWESSCRILQLIGHLSSEWKSRICRESRCSLQNFGSNLLSPVSEQVLVLHFELYGRPRMCWRIQGPNVANRLNVLKPTNSDPVIDRIRALMFKFRVSNPGAAQEMSRFKFKLDACDRHVGDGLEMVLTSS
jgi:hypothetical protein